MTDWQGWIGALDGDGGRDDEVAMVTAVVLTREQNRWPGRHVAQSDELRTGMGGRHETHPQSEHVCEANL
jgi:hypothetical protein